MARPRRPYVAIRQREGRSGIGLEVPLLYLSILVGRGGTMPLKRGMDTGQRGRMRWSSGGNTGLRCKQGVDNYFVYTMIFNIGPLCLRKPLENSVFPALSHLTRLGSRLAKISARSLAAQAATPPRHLGAT